MTGRYLDDFSMGQTFGSGALRVDAYLIKAFAAEFDPQPFHLDDAAAKDTVFGGLAASGWHTAALTMRLLVESEFRPAGGILGAGFDEFRWPRPVRPGDELHLEGPLGSCRRVLEEMIADIDHGLRLEEQGFSELIDGANVDAEEIARRAYGGWYLSAEEALSRGLVAGLV